MTELGKAFAGVASSVRRLHGMGSNKMVVEYQLEADSDEVHVNYDSVPHLEQLVQMGYLRKFVGNPYWNNKHRNWRYRFHVRDVYFGLTAKGWEVAPKYLEQYDRQNRIGEAQLKAKNYMEKVKDYNPITYEEAFALAMNGVL